MSPKYKFEAFLWPQYTNPTVCNSKQTGCDHWKRYVVNNRVSVIATPAHIWGHVKMCVVLVYKAHMADPMLLWWASGVIQAGYMIILPWHSLRMARECHE